MNVLSKGEQKLFAKYWGHPNLAECDEFWADVYETYKEIDIPMPMKHSPLTIRFVHDLLDCQKCGDCCRYKRIPIKEDDIKRIKEHCNEIDSFVQKCDEGLYLDGTNGCPFLKEKLCSIYKYRPDTCFLYPVQNGIKSMMGEELLTQMTIRLRCPQTLKMIRTIITDAVKAKESLLLPNLNIIYK